MVKFELTENDKKRVSEWYYTKTNKYAGAIGGRFSSYYRFLPDKTVMTIKDAIDKNEITIESMEVNIIEKVLDDYANKIFSKWKEKTDKNDGFTICFTSTSLGEIVTLCPDEGKDVCLTDFSNF